MYDKYYEYINSLMSNTHERPKSGVGTSTVIENPWLWYSVCIYVYIYLHFIWFEIIILIGSYDTVIFYSGGNEMNI